MAEAEFELHHANHTQHSAALSFRAEQNIFNAETYLVDHMYEIVQTADAAQQHAMDVSKDCLMDGTQPCTPASFDYEHYWETEKADLFDGDEGRDALILSKKGCNQSVCLH